MSLFRMVSFAFFCSASSGILVYMFDVRLAANLLHHAFSWNRGSMRYPTAKRVFSILILLPSAFILIFVNRLFMALDHIFFAGFKKQELRNVVLIAGVPRSATTYLFNLMASDKNNFTCFTLWEILLAPSIIQKYFYTGILAVDRLVGRPLHRLSRIFDRIFLSQISRLHEMGLSKPEEDEMLLVYAFSSVYLTFFFPDVHALDAYLFFDEEISVEKRKRIMHFHKRCIQRHVYFQDRNESRYFLSKNPSFISKTASLAETFQHAQLIYMLRSPLKTIPSTISLNKNLYSVFSGVIKINPLADKTKAAIIRWYKMADTSINRYWQHKTITVPFRRITKNPSVTLSNIYGFLKITPGDHMLQMMDAEQQKSSGYKTAHLYDTEQDEQVIRELEFIFKGRYRDEL